MGVGCAIIGHVAYTGRRFVLYWVGTALQGNTPLAGLINRLRGTPGPGSGLPSPTSSSSPGSEANQAAALSGPEGSNGRAHSFGASELSLALIIPFVLFPFPDLISYLNDPISFLPLELERSRLRRDALRSALSRLNQELAAVDYANGADDAGNARRNDGNIENRDPTNADPNTVVAVRATQPETQPPHPWEDFLPRGSAVAARLRNSASLPAIRTPRPAPRTSTSPGSNCLVRFPRDADASRSPNNSRASASPGSGRTIYYHPNANRTNRPMRM